MIYQHSPFMKTNNELKKTQLPAKFQNLVVLYSRFTETHKSSNHREFDLQTSVTKATTLLKK